MLHPSNKVFWEKVHVSLYDRNQTCRTKLLMGCTTLLWAHQRPRDESTAAQIPKPFLENVNSLLTHNISLSTHIFQDQPISLMLVYEIRASYFPPCRFIFDWSSVSHASCTNTVRTYEHVSYWRQSLPLSHSLSVLLSRFLLFFFFIFFFFLPKALTPRRDFFASVKGQAEHTHLSCVRNLPCTGPQGHIGILYNLWNQVGQKIKFIWGENEKMPWKRVSAVHLLAFVWRMFSLRHWRESMNNKWVLLQFRLFPPGVSCDDQELQNENHITRTMWFHSVLVLFWFRTWL